MRIKQIAAVGGSIWRVLDEKDHKVAEFYRQGDAGRFLRAIGPAGDELLDAVPELTRAVLGQDFHSLSCPGNQVGPNTGCLLCAKALRVDAAHRRCPVTPSKLAAMPKRLFYDPGTCWIGDTETGHNIALTMIAMGNTTVDDWNARGSEIVRRYNEHPALLKAIKKAVANDPKSHAAEELRRSVDALYGVRLAQSAAEGAR